MIPGFQDLMLPVLRAVVEEASTGALVQRMADEFGLSETERRELLPSGRQAVIANRTHWALAYLNKTKLIERTRRAHYRITDRGREILASEPGRVDLKFLQRFPELAEFRNDRSGKVDVEEVAEKVGKTPDEIVRSAFVEFDTALRQQLLTRIMAEDPAFFEKLVVELLVKMGFGRGLSDPGRAVGKAGDGGIDGVIDQDGLGLDRVYIQAKRYGADNAVGPGAINEFFGSLDDVKAAKGVFITTSRFTKSAEQTAGNKSKRIVLIDGDQLATLLIRHDVGVRIEQTFHIKKIDEDFFIEDV